MLEISILAQQPLFNYTRLNVFSPSSFCEYSDGYAKVWVKTPKQGECLRRKYVVKKNPELKVLFDEVAEMK